MLCIEHLRLAWILSNELCPRFPVRSGNHVDPSTTGRTMTKSSGEPPEFLSDLWTILDQAHQHAFGLLPRPKHPARLTDVGQPSYV